MAKQNQITILGYGSQGRAIALNLSDSGYQVTVGLRKRSKSRLKAKRDRIKTDDIQKSFRNASLIIVAIPDHAQQGVLGPVLGLKLLGSILKGASLIFLHGSTIHFGLVKPPPEVPVLLLAPHAPGLAVRENYLARKPFSAFYAVEQGPVKKGYELLIKLADGIGIPKSHLVKTTFADEAVGDLFGEQAVLCGGMARMLKLGFETLVEAGLPPQNAYLEVAYQLDLIIELVKQHGLEGMFKRISPMARFGSAVNGPKVVPQRVKAEMAKVLKDITSGKFIQKATSSGMKVDKKLMNDITSRLFDRQAEKFSEK
jgi:ketol-acid reductoisomerase